MFLLQVWTWEPTVGVCRAVKKSRDRNECWELYPACVTVSMGLVLYKMLVGGEMLLWILCSTETLSPTLSKSLQPVLHRQDMES